MRLKYLIVLASIGATVVLPGIIARLCGAPMSVLVRLAVIQLLILMPFVLTTLVSVGFVVAALIKKEWKSAGLCAVASCIPWLTWCVAAVVNDPGWQAVMGI